MSKSIVTQASVTGLSSSITTKIIDIHDQGGAIVMHNCDCIRGIADHVASGSVDVVVTSPPYSLGIEYRTYDDRIERGEYLEWTRKWASEVARASRRQGRSS